MKFKKTIIFSLLVIKFAMGFSQTSQFYINDFKDGFRERLWLYEDSTYKYVLDDKKEHKFSEGIWTFKKEDSTIWLNSSYSKKECFNCYQIPFFSNEIGNDSLKIRVGYELTTDIEKVEALIRENQDGELERIKKELKKLTAAIDGNVNDIKYADTIIESIDTIKAVAKNQMIVHRGQKTESYDLSDRESIILGNISLIDSVTLLINEFELRIKSLSKYSGGELNFVYLRDRISESERYFREYVIFNHTRLIIRKNTLIKVNSNKLIRVE